MSAKWNPDGKGIRRIPAALAEFAASKQREFWTNMGTSMAAGLVLSMAILALGGALSSAALVQMAIWLAGAVVLTLGLSYMA